MIWLNLIAIRSKNVKKTAILPRNRPIYRIRTVPFCVDDDEIALPSLSYGSDTMRHVDAVGGVNRGRCKSLFERETKRGARQIHHNGLEKTNGHI